MLKSVNSMLVLLAWSAVSVAAPNMSLPWNAGEEWVCTCGYGCGEHSDENNAYYSLDFDRVGIEENGPDQPILATAEGGVVFAGIKGGYGYTVEIDHGDGYVSRYAHLRYRPTVNGYIARGQQIGIMGGTSWEGKKSFKDHIHFMLLYNGVSNGKVLESKPEPMSGYVNFREGSSYVSDNDGTPLRAVTNILNAEYSRNGGALNFGTLSNPGNTYAGVHWYYAYDPYHRYRQDQPTVAATCYAQDYEGGTFRRSIIVYDALGGARRAYTVRTGLDRRMSTPEKSYPH